MMSWEDPLWKVTLWEVSFLCENGKKCEMLCNACNDLLQILWNSRKYYKILGSLRKSQEVLKNSRKFNFMKFL